MDPRFKDAERPLRFRRWPVLTGGLAYLAVLSALVARPAVALSGYERDGAAA